MSLQHWEVKLTTYRKIHPGMFTAVTIYCNKYFVNHAPQSGEEGD